MMEKNEEKEDRIKKMNKVEIFMLVFMNLIKANRTNRVDLALEKRKEVACKLFELFSFFFLGVAPIYVPYVQVAILNLPHP